MTKTTAAFSLRATRAWLLALAATWLAVQAPARAQVIFSNDFETDTSGFAAGGSLSALSRVSLPIDSGGPSSLNTSMWLGKLGDGVPKSGASDEIVTLALSGLTTGQHYHVAFDLLIGASWDGAAGCCGPDSWRLTVDGTTLVETIFSDGQQGVNVGAYSPQRYTDQGFLNTTGVDVPRFTGADAFYSANQGGNYAGDYAIYYFGHGDGNPVINFTAPGTTATLEFARYGNTSDSSDEYWALDNVVITAPEPEAALLAAAALLALLGLGAAARRQDRLLRQKKVANPSLEHHALAGRLSRPFEASALGPLTLGRTVSAGLLVLYGAWEAAFGHFRYLLEHSWLGPEESDARSPRLRARDAGPVASTRRAAADVPCSSDA